MRWATVLASGACVVACAPEAKLAEREGITVGTLTVSGPHTPAPAGEQAALYVAIRNAGAEPDTLAAIATPSAASAHVHRTIRDGGMMRMAPMEMTVIPAGEEVRLEPGGLHGMLTGLTESLAVGDTIWVTLTFARAGTVTVPVPVVSYAEVS